METVEEVRDALLAEGGISFESATVYAEVWIHRQELSDEGFIIE